MRRSGRYSVLWLAAPLAFFAAGCCNSGLIPNYEVLQLPAGKELYAVGSQWSTNAARPIEPPPAGTKTGTAAGVESMKSGIPKDQVDAGLKVPLLKWIGGSLSGSSSRTLQLDAANFKHEFLTTGSAIVNPSPMIWEVVTADAITFTHDRTSETDVELNVDVAKLKATVGGGGGDSIGIEFKKTMEKKYTVTSKKPLVLAIRIARSETRAKSVRSTLDLTDQAVNARSMQAGPFGYQFLVEKVDPVRRTVTVRITNGNFPQWTGDTMEFTREKGAWPNQRRNASAHPDDLEKNPDFIWDNLTLNWNPDLSKCEMLVDRQYQILRSVDSGLDTQ